MSGYESKPKVSVVMITYNHSAYIEQAIESVLMQNTDFSVELVIGEDASTDGTRDIVKRYGEKYPGIVRVLLNDSGEKIYYRGEPTGILNLFNALEYASGEYIALLEGDDFWTDPNKLRKQVEYLENHPQVSLCFHAVKYDYEIEGLSNKTFNFTPPGRKETYSVQELLQDNFISTPSVVFRNTIKKYPDWIYSNPVGDFPIFILNSLNGKIGYLDETMGSHRIHDGSYWGAMESERKVEIWLESVSNIYGFLEGSEHSKFALATLYYAKYMVAIKQKKKVQALHNLIKCLYLVPGHLNYRRKGLGKIIIEFVFPSSLINFIRKRYYQVVN